MGFVFIICLIVMYFISRYETKNGVVTNGLEIEKSMFKMSPGFTVGALIITGILVALYTVFWEQLPLIQTKTFADNWQRFLLFVQSVFQIHSAV